MAVVLHYTLYDKKLQPFYLHNNSVKSFYIFFLIFFNERLAR